MNERFFVAFNENDLMILIQNYYIFEHKIYIQKQQIFSKSGNHLIKSRAVFTYCFEITFS